jgi:hypothetical protein
MKNRWGLVLSLGSVILASSAAQAAGYRCQAQCVAVDAIDERIYLLDAQMITEADARKVQVFEQLKSKCENKALDYGVYAPVVLVNELDFEQSHSDSYSHSGYRRGYWSGWYGYYGYYPYYDSSHSSSSSVSSNMRVRYSPATLATSCERDREIEAGTPLEYVGDLPVMD